MEKKTFVFDLDGTICEEKEKGTHYSYFEAVLPKKDVVEKMRKLSDEGHKIIISTARHMGSTGGNVGIVNAHVAELTFRWLNKHKVPYDEVFFGKPLGDYYVDDKNISIEQFLNI